MKTKQIFVVSCLLFLAWVVWVGTARGGEIHDAANAGDVEKVKALLRTNPGLVNAKDKFGRTSLFYAAGINKEVNKEVVELLLAKGAEANAKDEFGDTPLSFAAAGGPQDVVELLLARGSDVNAKGDTRMTPLHLAARSCRKHVVELLLSKGAEVNAKDAHGQTPLVRAVGRCKDVVELLLSKGADVNARTNEGFTPLFFAARDSPKDVVELLLNKGSKVDAKANDGETPLFGAASSDRKDRKDVVELLLARGAEVAPRSSDGMTPLQVAEKAGKTDVADLLRKPTAKSADVALDEGLTAAREQQWAVAIRHFLKAQAARPTAPDLLFNLGLAESKVPGRELRAMAWLQAYLLAAPDAANAEAVRREIANLKVRVEATIERLVSQTKQLAGQFRDDTDNKYVSYRRRAFTIVAIAQARAGDTDGAELTLHNVGVDGLARAKQMYQTSDHYKNRYEYEPRNPPPMTAKDRLDDLLSLVNKDMKTELFTDPKGALQTIAAKPESWQIIGGIVNAIEQLADTLNDLKALSR